MTTLTPRAIRVTAGDAELDGDLTLPEEAAAVVLFAHGSGSSRYSPRNRYVAGVLSEAGLATLLLDLLTPAEEAVDERTARLRFDIELLAGRLVAAADWLQEQEETSGLPIGCFGASTGAAAVLMLAAERPAPVRAVVSRGGRPDLAEDALERVRAPTLLLVGELDEQVVELNRQAMARMQAETKLEIVRGATHLFPEPGTLEQVADLARDWLVRHLAAR